MNAVVQDFGMCPCADPLCDLAGTKLARKTGHLVGCTCASCKGAAINAKGRKAQDRVLRDAARAEGRSSFRPPANEEGARLLLHYESKEGEQIPRGLRGEIIRHWEIQARNHAHHQTPMQKWALVFTMPDQQRRIWMDFEEFLSLVSEIQELA